MKEEIKRKEPVARGAKPESVSGFSLRGSSILDNLNKRCVGVEFYGVVKTFTDDGMALCIQGPSKCICTVRRRDF